MEYLLTLVRQLNKFKGLPKDMLMSLPFVLSVILNSRSIKICVE